MDSERPHADAKLLQAPCADSAIGELLLDVIPIVAAVGYAVEVSHCRFLCGLTYRSCQDGDTNDMIVSSLRIQCGEREAKSEQRSFIFDPSANWEAEGEGVWIENTTQLIRATMLNNLPRVIQLIQMDAPLDLSSEYGNTALHEAIYRGFMHIAVALLDGKYKGQGSSIEKRSIFGYSPLCAACDAQQVDMVRMLLARGARQDVPDFKDSTGLHLATYCNNIEIVSLLVKAPGFDKVLEIRTADYQYGGTFMTPLEMAIFYERPEIEAILRANGAK